MGRQWPIPILLLGLSALGKYYVDSYVGNLTNINGWEAPPEKAPTAVPQPTKYVDPYLLYSNECAMECFCTSSYPFAMYCDNRQLKAIPDVPRHIYYLYLQFNDIEALPAKPFLNATSLREINLSHNKLKSSLVDSDAFVGMKDLRRLHLGHNNLEEVPSLPKSLQQVLFGFNKISKISAGSLQGLGRVTMLDLCNNRLTDSGFKGKILADMKSLMQVNMCHNKLKSMPPDLPASVLQLSLENNSISSIPAGYFKKTPNLISLRISHNILKTVPYTAFNLSTLMELNLGHNQLSKAFFIPRSLEHLYLNHNEFQDLNVSLMCPSPSPSRINLLRYIRIDNNRLKGPVDNFVYFCFPHIQSIFYGEQKTVDSYPKPQKHKKPELPQNAKDYQRKVFKDSDANLV